MDDKWTHGGFTGKGNGLVGIVDTCCYPVALFGSYSNKSPVVFALDEMNKQRYVSGDIVLPKQLKAWYVARKVRGLTS